MDLDQTKNPEGYVSLNVDLYDKVNDTKEQERKIRKRKLKKEKKKKLKELGGGGDSSDDEDNNLLMNDDEVVEFITPSGEVYELHAFGDASVSKYDVKLHMINERTFFKYLFSSFHLGGMGTFLLTYFTQADKYKILIVIIIWIAAFSFVFWGLQGFYHRKKLMEDGKIKSIEGINPHGPSYVLLVFVLTFLLTIIYGISTHQYPGKKTRNISGPNTPPPITAFLPME